MPLPCPTRVLAVCVVNCVDKPRPVVLQWAPTHRDRYNEFTNRMAAAGMHHLLSQELCAASSGINACEKTNRDTQRSPPVGAAYPPDRQLFGLCTHRMQTAGAVDRGRLYGDRYKRRRLLEFSEKYRFLSIYRSSIIGNSGSDR